jgi:hypothetical protein
MKEKESQRKEEEDRYIKGNTIDTNAKQYSHNCHCHNDD